MNIEVIVRRSCDPLHRSHSTSIRRRPWQVRDPRGDNVFVQTWIADRKPGNLHCATVTRNGI